MPLPVHHEDARFLELLRKWQSGDFTRSDEQELFRLAESDDFRKEALDGYTQTAEQDHATVLENLRGKIQGNRAKRRALLPQMMAAAAILLLIVVAVWFVNVNPPSGEKETAILDQQQVMAPEQDTRQPDSEPVPSVQNPPFHTQTAPHPIASTREEAGSSTATSNGAGPTLSAAPPTASRQANEPTQADTEDIAAADKAGEAEAYQKEKSDAQPYSDVLGQKRSADAARKKSAPATKPAVEMKDTMASGKAKSANGANAASYPATGWDAFKVYLRTNARLTTAARSNNVSGTVRLRFRVDPGNRPVDFSVLNSLGFGCDEEAERLVKAFSWQYVNDTPLTVDVPFIR